MFADDTTITIHQKNIDLLKRDMTNILIKTKNWFDMNRLALNESKTRCIQYFRYYDLDILLNNNKITQVGEN